MKYLCTFLILTFTILSCTNVEDDVDSKILGTWKWVRTTGGIGGVGNTPQSTGDTQTLIITPDNLKWFKNDSLISEKPYIITTDTAHTTRRLQKMIIYPDDGYRYTYDIKENFLFLNGDFVDSFNYTFRRE